MAPGQLVPTAAAPDSRSDSSVRCLDRSSRSTRHDRTQGGELGMTRTIADIGAAVIGTGFIGTVHVEALRRIGVQVRGVLGSTPGARRRPGRPPSACREPMRRSTSSSTTRPSTSVHVTSPNDLHLPQAKAVLAAGRHVVCEKPLAMTADGVRASSSRWPPSTGLVNAVELQHPLLPAEPARPRRRRRRARSATSGWSRAATSRTGSCSTSDWNWRLQPERGGALRAVGDIGSHWLDLTTLHHRPADRRGHGRPRDVHPAAREPTGPVETFSTERAAETVTREIATEDAATILLRFENGARGAVEHQPDQRRPEELAPVRGRRIARVGRLGLGAARPALDRPPRAAQRDPDQEPGADGRRAGRGGRRPAGRPRRGLRRHVRRPLPGHLRRHRRRPAVRPARATRPSPTATTRCSSTTPSPRAPGSAAGSTSSEGRSPAGVAVEARTR